MASCLHEVLTFVEGRYTPSTCLGGGGSLQGLVLPVRHVRHRSECAEGSLVHAGDPGEVVNY